MAAASASQFILDAILNTEHSMTTVGQRSGLLCARTRLRNVLCAQFPTPIRVVMHQRLLACHYERLGTQNYRFLLPQRT